MHIIKLDQLTKQTASSTAWGYKFICGTSSNKIFIHHQFPHHLVAPEIELMQTINAHNVVLLFNQKLLPRLAEA